jgi:hypothetical protein
MEILPVTAERKAQLDDYASRHGEDWRNRHSGASIR